MRELRQRSVHTCRRRSQVSVVDRHPNLLTHRSVPSLRQPDNRARGLSLQAAKWCTIFSMLSVLTWRPVSSILYGNRRDQRQATKSSVATQTFNLRQKHPLFALSLLSHETRTLSSCSSNQQSRLTPAP